MTWSMSEAEADAFDARTPICTEPFNCPCCEEEYEIPETDADPTCPECGCYPLERL